PSRSVASSGAHPRSSALWRLLSSSLSSRTRPPPSATLFPYTTLFRSQARVSLSKGHPRPVQKGITISAGTGAQHDFTLPPIEQEDRKSTRLNSSHVKISYAVFCLKKKRPNRTARAQSEERMEVTLCAE